MKKKKSSGSQYTGRVAKTEHQKSVLASVAIWAAYYRSNIHRFAIDYLHIDLKLFQIILLNMMNKCSTLVFIACRGLGKTFLCAIFCCIRCILYPGTQICIASGTRGQALNVLEKIMTELKPRSPELANEIDETETTLNNTTAKISFKNGSYIKVVTSKDTSRGNRAHILIIDEFRMVDKTTIDTILRRFLASPRHPKYMDLPEYKGDKSLLEPNKTMYLSSAYYKDHWSYTRCKDSCRFMLDETKKNFVCGFPYQLAIQEDLVMEEQIVEQMMETDFNEVTWSMEMDSLFYGNTTGSFFDFNSISKNRRLENVMLPNELSSRIPSLSCFSIPVKRPGEFRILSADIALMASKKHKNDATSIFINQLLPTKAGRYVSNIVYTENHEGNRTEKEALSIRKLFDEYDCDYIALDVKNVGLSIYDALANELPDPDTGEVYPAISCCNNEDFAERCVDQNARKVIWAINGSSRFNSECALLLREGFLSGRIRLPINEFDAQERIMSLKGVPSLDIAERTEILLPYINTSLLVNELIKLEHENKGGVLRLFETSTSRKDRYSSLSYNFYVASQIERKEMRDNWPDTAESVDQFIIRAPRYKKERW